MTMRAPARRLLWLALSCGLLGLALATQVACGGRPDDESGSSADPDPTPPASAFAGTYVGTFDGSDTGNFEFTVDDAGDLTGSGTSTADGAFTLSGSVDDTGDFSASTTTGATWDGSIDDTGAVTGSWVNDPDSGTLTGAES